MPTNTHLTFIYIFITILTYLLFTYLFILYHKQVHVIMFFMDLHGNMSKVNFTPYVCLKTENCCLKTFVKIRVGEIMYGNA